MTGRRSTSASASTTASRRGVVLTVFLALVGAILVTLPPQSAQAACTGNAIVCENQLTGTPRSVWDIDGVGDESIQGYATQISVNAGSAIQFKVDTNANAYSIKIYRLGYYQGNGAREVATVSPSASLPQNQPACATDPDTEIYDCGTWGVSASWNVPSTAVSGVYIARLIRGDTGGDSHIPFIVRNDGNTSQVLFQTADTTWQAYNTYGGSSFYHGKDNGRAYKLSYNRPFATRGSVNGRDFLFSNEYPMIRFLEQNGYDVSYVSGLDTSEDPALLPKHKVFLSVGHDEYWSKTQRDNVLASRNGGTNLAFFAGNDVYWKTRWEPSQDGRNTANRTLVCYKDTWAGSPIDPVTPTSTWRDPRFGDLGHGPENSLIGTQYQANSVDLPIKVDPDEGKLRLWRGTNLGSQSSGGTATLAAHTVGYESNEDVDNGYRPAGLIRMSTTTGPTPEYLTDFGNTVVPGTTTHHLTMYKAPSGALVFSAGSIQWAWGLDSNHDGTAEPADSRIRQATVNILADMSAQATTLASDLTAAAKSTDTAAPTSTITQPTSGSNIAPGDLVTVKGAASDVGGRIGGVEVSLDGGANFHAAEGRESYTYTGLLTGSGSGAIQVRATDDSANMQATTTKLAVTSDCPCSLFGALAPTTAATTDTSAVTLGTRFTPTADGFITGIRFYKGVGNAGSHTGTLYSSAGAVLATATFSNETASGWQMVNFSSAVPVTKDTTYIAAYFAPQGRYAADANFFSARGFTSGKLTAPGGPGNTNGVYASGDRYPTSSYRQTNYYVDAVYNSVDTTPTTVTKVTPIAGSSSVPTTTSLKATFSRQVTASSVDFQVLDADNAQVTGTTSYDSDSKTATFNPTQGLGTSTTYSVSVRATATNEVAMVAPYTWSFTTARPPATPGICPCTLFDDSDAPTNAPDNETKKVELGVAFTATNAGVISGVRFYKAQANTGTHVVSLWDTSGARLATATVANESTAGWQETMFGSPVAITANTTYIASYTAPAGRYSAVGGGLSSKITRNPLASLANGGRYTYGTGAPTSTSSANYFVDPIFNAPPGQAPKVASTSPGDGATSVATSAQIRVTFDTAVQPGSASVEVTAEGASTPVSGNVSSESLSTSVMFTPSTALQAGKKYTVKVSGAKSASGTPMNASFTSEFTTAGASACPCSLMETTTVPSLSDSGDSSATTLGLRFTPSVDGYITGIRYFRDAANTGTHKGKLYSASGSVLASVNFANDGTGWQQAKFDAAVPVEAGSVYVASYYAPNGHYSASSRYFTNQVVNAPLASSGSGGVYADGDAFPSKSYLETNYYVDVVFTTSDEDPPSVSEVTPTDGDTADVDTLVKAKFARAVDPNSIAFTLKKAGSTVAGQVSYDASGRTATFTPAADLPNGSSYTASVTATSTTGVAMTSPKTWTFSTIAAAPTGEQVSLFAPTATPATPAWNDNGPVTVGVRFSSSKAGQVTAIKFYAGPGNTGTQTVTLWNSGGTALGTGTSNSSATGWRTVNLTTPVTITAGQTYTASYYAPNGHYSVTGGAFSSAYTAGPLTVPASGATYRYPNGFPSASSTANYWVDIVLVVPS